MKIESIDFQNFRAHSSLWIDLAPVTAIVGPNGSGKSTVLAGLEYAISARCTLTNERGLNGDLVSRGARSGFVSVNLADGDAFTRTTEGALSMSWAGRVKAADSQYELEKRIGCKGDAARLAIRASRFFGMDSKTQKTLLSEMVGLEIRSADVLEALADRAKVVGLPLVDVCKSVVGSASTWANIPNAYKACFEERACQKRLAKDLASQVEAFVDDGEVFTSANELTSMAARHKAMVVELQNLCHEHGTLLGSAKALENAQVALERAAVGYKDAWASAKDLGALDCTCQANTNGMTEYCTCGVQQLPCGPDNSDVIAALEAESRDNCTVTALLSQLSREWKVAQQELDRLQAEFANAGQCPYATGTACAGAALRQKAIEDQIDTAKDRIEALSERYEEAKVAVRAQRSNAVIQDELAAARTARDARLKEAHIRESAVLRLHHATIALEQERERVEELTSAANAHRVAEIEAYKTGLTATVEQLAGELDILRANAAMKAQRDSTRERLAKAQANVAALEELVPFFAPNGYQAEVLQSQMGGLVNAVNSVLSRWGMCVRYTGLDLLMEVNVQGEWFEWKALADSTQILVGLAHQVAFATMEGSSTGFVVVDRIESLDDHSQQTLFAACEDLASSVPGLHHIILLGVRCVAPPASVSCVDLSMKRAVAA